METITLLVRPCALTEQHRALKKEPGSDYFSNCPNQEIGLPFIFKGLIIGTCSYFGADSATKNAYELSRVLPMVAR
jgi:hypothetical protein